MVILAVLGNISITEHLHFPPGLPIFSPQFYNMKNLLFLLLILVCTGWISCSPQKPAEDAAEGTAVDTTKAAEPAEFADTRYMDLGKKMLAQFASGDIDGYMSNFADNAVYKWNNGDSIAGKAVISDFWKKRMAETIDSVSFTNEIYLPVKVNKPQSTEPPGIYLLAWYQTHAKYKSGKSMNQGMHAVMHFDANDKIDFVYSYRDNALINEAMKK